MSATKRRVKIVKRRHRERASARPPATDMKKNKQVQREIAGTVASWVAEKKDVVNQSYKLVFQTSDE
ncbi:MAG: hypothetical protein C5B55_01420 [Blastocatellia bacterium]|nr:MAG: hypothetical protein C5B55_01420 [Blastocatellia bacterium]